MKCQNGTCEHTAYAATLSGLRKDNLELREELAAVKAICKAMVETIETDIRKTGGNLRLEDLLAKTPAQSLAEVRADAVRDAAAQTMSGKAGYDDLHQYANKLEAGL